MELLLLGAVVAGSVGWLAQKVSRWRATSRRRRELAAQQLAERGRTEREGARKRAREAENPVLRPAPPPRPPFRVSAAGSALGERFVDVLPLVAARGYAAEASQALWLCGETWRRGDLGATNDVIVSSLRLQCGAGAAREARCEDFDFVDPWDGSLVTMLWALRS